MADIDKIAVNNTTYNIKDSTARDSISPFISTTAYSDYNALTENGMYRVANNGSNGPGAWAAAVIVVKGYSGLVQISFRVSNSEVYIRGYIDNVWGNWKKLAFSSQFSISKFNFDGNAAGIYFYSTGSSLNFSVALSPAVDGYEWITFVIGSGGAELSLRTTPLNGVGKRLITTIAAASQLMAFHIPHWEHPEHRSRQQRIIWQHLVDVREHQRHKGIDRVHDQLDKVHRLRRKRKRDGQMDYSNQLGFHIPGLRRRFKQPTRQRFCSQI